MVNKRRWFLITLIALAISGWWLVRWPYLRLPGSIVVHKNDWGSPGSLYRYRPGRLLKITQWKRLTPANVYVFYPAAWAPDGQQVAFRCSHRNGKIGLCLMDQNGRHFRWLVVVAKTLRPDYPAPSSEYTYAKSVSWTSDGRYIIFLKETGITQYIDPQTGETGPWQEELPLYDTEQQYVALPDVHIPKENVAKSGAPCTGTCTTEGWLGVRRGIPSPDGRYVLWIQTYGESDPYYLIIYDTHSERLLHLPTFTQYLRQPVWLPGP
jgi:dipeptidyl aminopeptidase/acylaminoacyl peptidase